MTLHVNIGEAKTRLSQLVAAALRGEQVVLDRNGQPQVKLVPVAEASEAERVRLAEQRRAFVAKWAADFHGYNIGPEEVRAAREYSEERRRLHGDDLR